MDLGFVTDRLKTGTPARVDARTVDFSGLEVQPGDVDVRWFSFDPEVRAVRGCCIGTIVGYVQKGEAGLFRQMCQHLLRRAQDLL